MKGICLVSAWLVFGTIAQAIAQPAPGCGATHQDAAPWTKGNAVLFRTSGLKVDADGAPDSYLVDGKGLSSTCDGVAAIENGRKVTRQTDKAHWEEKCRAAWSEAVASGDYKDVAIFGFMTDTQGVPLRQGDRDPLPRTGYISTTAVVVPGALDNVQRRYVDATRIPYVVLPVSFRTTWAVKPGGLAIVYRPKTGKVAFAVFGDDGDLGEGSVRLHQDLGSDPMVVSDGVQRAKAGIEDPVLTVVFPLRISAPRSDADAWAADIKAQGEQALAAFGGAARLAICAK